MKITPDPGQPWTLPLLVAQLEACGYENIAGPLKNNQAFIALKEMATNPDVIGALDRDFGTSVKFVCAHLQEQGKSYLEIAVDPTTKEAAWSFEATELPATRKLLDILQRLLPDLEWGTATRWKGDGSRELRQAVSNLQSAIGNRQ